MTPIKNKKIKGIQESEEEFISLLNQKKFTNKIITKGNKIRKN